MKKSAKGRHHDRPENPLFAGTLALSVLMISHENPASEMSLAD